MKGVRMGSIGKKQRKSDCKGCTLEELEEEKYKVIHEDKDENGFILNYAINPEVDGHLVVQPKFHAEQLCDLSEEQAKRLMEIIWASCKALQNLYLPNKIYIFSFNEKRSYHLHFHIKPKADIEPKGPAFVDWTDPKIKTVLDAIEKEKDKNKKRKMRNILKRHHEEIVNRIKEDVHIKKLVNEKIKK